jgi:hypothetical protein
MPAFAGPAMALEAKQSVCIVCGDFRFTDYTRPYDASDNTTGYGTPNSDFGDLTPYTAEFFPPNTETSVYTLDLYNPIAVPNADGDYVYDIDIEEMGFDVPKSGIWTITVTLGDEVKNIQILADGDIKAKIIACYCSGGSKHTGLYLDLMAARLSVCCGKYEEAQCIIDQTIHVRLLIHY